MQCVYTYIHMHPHSQINELECVGEGRFMYRLLDTVLACGNLAKRNIFK